MRHVQAKTERLHSPRLCPTTSTVPRHCPLLHESIRRTCMSAATFALAAAEAWLSPTAASAGSAGAEGSTRSFFRTGARHSGQAALLCTGARQCMSDTLRKEAGMQTCAPCAKVASIESLRLVDVETWQDQPSTQTRTYGVQTFHENDIQ